MNKLDLDYALLEASGFIKDPEANLRSKVNSLTEQISLLEAKKARLDYEIRKQKKSLVRKREELRRSSTSIRKRTSPLSEAGDEFLLSGSKVKSDLQRLDSQLLQESDRVLS